MRRMKGRSGWFMTLKSIPTTLIQQTPCQWPTTWAKWRSTKRHVGISRSWMIIACKCVGIVGQAFGSEGLLESMWGSYPWWNVYITVKATYGISQCVSKSLQAVLEPCTEKMTTLEESNQYSRGARRCKIHRVTPGWLRCRSPDSNKYSVLWMWT